MQAEFKATNKELRAWKNKAEHVGKYNLKWNALPVVVTITMQ